MSGVSFVITIYNKRDYLARVVESLKRQTGDFAREFVFVDDGSTDGSAAFAAELTQGWPHKVEIVTQGNAGASAATNAGVKRASLEWLKFLDGDDVLVPEATERLLDAANAKGMSLAYGELGTYLYGAVDPLVILSPLPPATVERDGLARFIRNCPCNSSTILVGRERYWAAGGCDERLVSPDQALFLRLFAKGGAAYIEGDVALAPDEAPHRLSEQRRRSRYESVLALFYLVSETRDLGRPYQVLAYRRALSRAWRFYRAHGGRLVSVHWLRYLASLVRVPGDPAPAIYHALAAFTEDGSSERPESWMPGAIRGAARTAGEA